MPPPFIAIIAIIGKVNINQHLSIVTCMQAPDFYDTTPVIHRTLQPAPLWFADIAQKPEYIQQIRLP